MNRPMKTVARDGRLEAVRLFFDDLAHELAEAANLLGGAAAADRVISCGIYLDSATRMDSHILRELVALHRLLALHDVGDPDRIETSCFSGIDPASREVEKICLLTDMLEELLRMAAEPAPEGAVTEADEAPSDPAIAA